MRQPFTTRRVQCGLILIALMLGACTGAPRTGSSGPEPAAATDATIGATDYNDPVWKELIAAARAEGRVVVAVNPNPEITGRLPSTFKDRFGVDVELVAGRSGDLMTRLDAEHTAGLSTIDVAIAGGDSAARMYQNGWLQPIRPLLVAPTTADPSLWLDDRLPFLDPEEQLVLQLERTIQGSWFVNPEVVSESDVRTLDDLLDPRWKGKITMDDLTSAGLGQNNAAYLYLAKGDDFFRKLYVEQAPMVSRDDRQMEDWLVRGVYPISFGLAVKNEEQLKEMGLPIRNAGTLGGGGWVRGPSVSYLTNAPHPNAAKLFLNWLASQEGLRFHSEAEKLPPLRKDIDHPWATGDEQVPTAGRTYAMNADSFEFITVRKPPVMTRIREITQP